MSIANRYPPIVLVNTQNLENRWYQWMRGSLNNAIFKPCKFSHWVIVQKSANVKTLESGKMIEETDISECLAKIW